MSSACLRFALAFCLAAGPVSARELRVCADPNNRPFSNERREGFENQIAEIVAKELGATVAYTWWAQRRGFLRETVNAGLCDLVMATPAGSEMLATTRPYYRSTYMFLTKNAPIESFDDPRLKSLRIGVQVVGDDGASTPPAVALAARGIIENVRGYTVYGNYAAPNPAARIVDAVRNGEVDVAAVWGPFAGALGRELVATPVPPLDRGTRMTFAIAMGTRKADVALRDEVQRVLDARKTEIEAVLDDFGVPRVGDRPGPEAARK